MQLPVLSLCLATLLLLIPAAKESQQPEPSRGLVFQELNGEETGLKAIMEDWRATEFKRQGGNFGSHGWWPWGVAAFDYDNDGHVDLLIQQHGSAGSLIARNQFKKAGKLQFSNANPDLGLP